MIKDKKVSTLIHEVGLNNFLPDSEVESIITSVFKTVSNEMRSGGTKSIRVMHWGIFFPRKYIKKFEANKHIQAEASNRSSSSTD